ncbi:MAG TPA: 50S ribosomal protein L9 [Anaerolineae bacterium]
MKVLLTQDVFNLGHAGEVKTVADGYGRNYLLPRNLAVVASVSTLKRADAVRGAAVKRRAQEQSDLDAVAQVINGQTLHFMVRTGEKGKLFGSITTSAIAEKLSVILGKEFDKRKVALREPIRDIGAHVVTVRLSADVAPTVNVIVTPEGVALPAAAAPAPVAETAPAAAEAPSQSA